MKVRQGFVSNSSSSSFIIYATKEAFDAALAECNPLQKFVVSAFIGGTEKFLGRDLLSYSYCSGNNGDWYYEQVDKKISEFGLENPNTESDEDEDEDDDGVRDEINDFAFGGFESLLAEKAKALGEETISHSEDS